ncbi:MAG: Rieske (2Fe-2S) protein [Acidobacteriia bacterium]|nr:Rieske (2Fe-2S) protein [Terriglobia bacterium]
MSVDRRALLLSAIGVSLGFAQDDPASVRPKPGDLLTKVGDAGKTPLTPNDIPLAAGYTAAWAMDPADNTVRSGSRLNQVLLLRFDPASLATTTREHAADGVVAYTSICTHNGCDIDQWLAKEQQLFCSCHESIFDPRDGGKVLDGPAPRALPALPLAIADGALVVAKPFTTPVGYERG